MGITGLSSSILLYIFERYVSSCFHIPGSGYDLCSNRRYILTPFPDLIFLIFTEKRMSEKNSFNSSSMKLSFSFARVCQLNISVTSSGSAISISSFAFKLSEKISRNVMSCGLFIVILSPWYRYVHQRPNDKFFFAV